MHRGHHVAWLSPLTSHRCVLGWNWTPREQLGTALPIVRNSWGPKTHELRQQTAFKMVTLTLPLTPTLTQPLTQTLTLTLTLTQTQTQTQTRTLAQTLTQTLTLTLTLTSP